LSVQKWQISIFCIVFLTLSLLLISCGVMTPAKKPEIGPAGKPVETKPNPPILERFWSPPINLYDLESIAGQTFEGINKEQWPTAEAGLNNLQILWQNTKPMICNKKGVEEADEALNKLALSIAAKQVTTSYENLNKFMGSIAEIGKSYKLSPIADIITVANAIRNVSFYAEEKNWSKAAAKVKELEGTWEQLKPNMEKVGILGEITKTHANVKQLKDAVNAENQGSVKNHIANINESMGSIREFYRGK